jgi:hypothetical protein
MMRTNALDAGIQWEGISDKQGEGGEENINDASGAKNPYYLGGFSQ